MAVRPSTTDQCTYIAALADVLDTDTTLYMNLYNDETSKVDTFKTNQTIL